ncbi:MAG: alpha/beta fold hydrolase [Gemmatimonadaceae bacterium]|nr:alpha/beta fold hydrolase [Gemmatimonadaceae bacterium]
MPAIHFGPSAAPLFGVYQPPLVRVARATGVVLAPAFGREYILSHFALRTLAEALTQRGAHVLRFDYRGSGDSFGDDTSADLDRWVEDIRSAVDELRDTAGLSAVTVVGARLGGTLAAEAAARHAEGIDGVVAWDPVVDGSAYVRWLRDVLGRAPTPLPDGRVDVGGHAMSTAFWSGVQQLQAGDTLRALGDRLRVVIASDAGTAALLPAGLHTLRIDASGSFDQALRTGNSILGGPIIAALRDACASLAP